MAAQDQQQIDGQVALLRNLVEQLRKDMEAREREQDLQQDRNRWQNEAADWKRQAQNLLPPPQTGSATSGNLGNAPATEPATTGNRLTRALRWLLHGKKR